MFELTIELGNEAMQNTSDVATALERVAMRLRHGDTDGRIMDFNGNKVGRFTFDFEPDEE